MENVNQVIADILSQDDISGGFENPWANLGGGGSAGAAGAAGAADAADAAGAAAGISGGSTDGAAAGAATDMSGGKRKLPAALRENHKKVMMHYHALVAKYGKGSRRNGMNLMTMAMKMTKKKGSPKRSRRSRH